MRQQTPEPHMPWHYRLFDFLCRLVGREPFFSLPEGQEPRKLRLLRARK